MRIEFDPADLLPLVETIVTEVLSRLPQHDDGRLAYSEIEAAALLGVGKHVLRDCRLAGQVEASKVGREWRYTRAQLVEFLARQKV